MTTLKACCLTSAWFIKYQFEESVSPNIFVYQINLQEWLNVRKILVADQKNEEPHGHHWKCSKSGWIGL